jgi:hypothetical protein
MHQTRVEGEAGVSSTRISRRVNAPRATVYRALQGEMTITIALADTDDLTG